MVMQVERMIDINALAADAANGNLEAETPEADKDFW